jgi:hypothetical protein
MPKEHEQRRFEVVHTAGDRDDFAAALGEALDALHTDHPTLKIHSVSHAMAIDAGGQIHWSALVDAKP